MLPVKVHFPGWLTRGKVKILTSLSHLKVVWSIWNLRSFILVSLGLQVILIAVAPFRKKTANSLVIAAVWLGYLLADYIAIQAVGLIPKYPATVTSPAEAINGDILAFWAPFLLVHLGGPDPITALALEDNELWTRTFLHLLTYSAATGRVFFQSLPANLLSIPTFLMGVAGILKYAERMMSLYSARLTQFKSSMLPDADPGPNYAKLMESYDSYLKSSLPATFDTNLEPDQQTVYVASTAAEEDDYSDDGSKMESKAADDKDTRLSNVKLVRDAFRLFDKYKGLYVDLIFTFHDRNQSRLYFLNPTLTPEDAFTVLELELNFTYEVFFTKMIVIHKTWGAWMRAVSFVFQLSSLLIWILFINKSLYHRKDIWITYILLVGAIAIDIVAFFMVLASDWTVAMLKKESETRAWIYNSLLSARSRSWGKCWGHKESGIGQRIRRAVFRRWSESIFKFNLIDYCVNRPSNWFVKLLFKLPVIKDKCVGVKYVSSTWFANDMRDFIFDELQEKGRVAEDPKDAEEMCESKGEWALRSLAGLGFEPSLLYQWTADVEYDECLLLWHIATELLYQVLEEETKGSMEDKYRRYCKTLSDYMLYLLNRQPVMMLAVAGISDVRFRDTCAEASIFFERVMVIGKVEAKEKESKEERHKEACRKMMGVNTDTSPRDIKGDRSKSVLFEAVQLAKQLKKTKDMEKQERGEEVLVGMWEVMAKVWVELMCYSASHCRASAHAALLKQGGELLTLVWLLMVHLGLGKQFRITKGNARSKLIITK